MSTMPSQLMSAARRQGVAVGVGVLVGVDVVVAVGVDVVVGVGVRVAVGVDVVVGVGEDTRGRPHEGNLNEPIRVCQLPLVPFAWVS
jgi:hypothetical protein